MSKKKVEQILKLVATGSWPEVDDIAATIEGGFLRRRLELALGQPQAAANATQAMRHFGYLSADADAPSEMVPSAPSAGQVSSARGSPDHLDGIPRSVSSQSFPAALQVPSDILLGKPESFLLALAETEGRSVRLEDVHFIQPWALVALATLARAEQTNSLNLRPAENDAGRFAHALGVFDVIEDREVHWQGEEGRTVRVQRFRTFESVEPTARRISRLVLQSPEQEDTRRAIYYVLVELLRNVVQHSRDPLGGVVAAQLMNERQRYSRPTVQVTVADAGIGVYRALTGMHPKLSGPEEALEKALWPHYSGTFEEGMTGAGQNAGLGLFFISEMAKLVGGRLLLASRGAAIRLQVDPDDWEKHTISELTPAGVGFPGTLVSFELPLDSFQDYEGLISTIQDRARERTPQRVLHHWVQFVDAAPEGALHIRVTVGAEDTVAARVLSEQVVEHVFRKRPVALDFSGLSICTQSYLHALMFETVRTAWARQTPLFIVGARPGVKSGVELLENYALGG